MKKYYKSRELWVGMVWLVLLAMRAFDVDADEGTIIDEAKSIYLVSTPAIMMILRLFFTKDKLAF